MAMIIAIKKCGTRLTREINKWLAIKNSRQASYTIHPRVYDCLVIGAGGAGLRAAIGMGQEQFTRVIVSRVYPSRSQRNAAQGDMNAAMGYAANRKKSVPMPTFCAIPRMPQQNTPLNEADEKKY